MHYNFSDGPGNLSVSSIDLVFTGDVNGRTVHLKADTNAIDATFDGGNAGPAPAAHSGTLDGTGAITFDAVTGPGYTGLSATRHHGRPGQRHVGQAPGWPASILR